MSDSNQSGKSRGTGRIAQLLAHARLESEGLAPSLDNPTRPKTPAGFDDKIADPRMSILQMKTKATSRSKALVNSTLLHKQLRDNIEKNASATLKASATIKSQPNNVKSSAPLARIPDATFNSQRLLSDLGDIEVEFENMSVDDISRMLGEQITEFIKFLNSMKSDTELEIEMTSEVENIVLKFSKIALLILYRDSADQVLSLLRLNLRILVPLLRISSEDGAFDLGLTSVVLKQCTQALMQVCKDNIHYNNTGEACLQLLPSPTPTPVSISILNNNKNITTSAHQTGDIYQDLDDGDIEIEDNEGRFVPQLSSQSSTISMTTSVEISNNCELTGVAQLLSLLNSIWKSLHGQIKLHITTSTDIQNNSIIHALIDSGCNIVTILRLISTDEIDSKRLNSAGILKVLVKGLKLFQIPQILSYIKMSLSTVNIDGHDEDLCGTVFINCLSQILLIIRNFSIVKSCKQQLLEQNVIPLLCILLRSYKHQSIVIVNCARVLAKLSLYERVRDQINANPEHIACLVGVVVHEASQMGGVTTEQCSDIAGLTETEELVWPGEHTWTVLTRLCFTLGNLTTTNVENRRLIGKQLGLTDHIVLLLQVCTESMNRIARRNDEGEDVSEGCSDEDSRFTASDEEECIDKKNTKVSLHQQHTSSVDRSFEVGHGNDNADDDSRSGEREFLDATIKLVRLLANLSIDADIGSALGARLDTLEMLNSLLAASSEGESNTHEEMQLNVIAACTNITYFSCQFINQHQGSTTTNKAQTKLAERMLEVSRHMSSQLMNCLFSANAEIQLEAARVLGNLTRTAAIRLELITHRIDEVLVQLLKHDDWDVVAAVSGVLVNLSADARCKEALLKPSSQLLVAFSWTLRKVGMEYPELSILICQALYNLLLGDNMTKTVDGVVNNRPIYDRIHRTLTELSETASSLELDNTEEMNRTQLDSFVQVATAVLKLLTSTTAATTV